MALSPKRQAFVREYLIDLNATAAYKRAGYKGTGRSAENSASEILGNLGVQQAIQDALAKRSERTGITAEWITEHAKAEVEGDTTPAARVAALKLLAQMGGHLVHRHKHEVGATMQLVEEIIDADAAAKDCPPPPGAGPLPPK